MGLNTTILILNDCLEDVRKDAKLGELIYTAVQLGKSDGLQPVGNGVYIIETHHADDTAIVAVGGNTAKVVGHIPTLNAVLSDDKDFAVNIAKLLQAKYSPTKSTPRLDEMRELRKHAKRTDFSALPQEDSVLSEASTEDLNAEAKRRGFRLITLRRKTEPPKRLTAKKR